jgi:Pentapeptide repeats (8 copies)
MPMPGTRQHKFCLGVALVFLLVATCALRARADVYQWEYINPADPSQGKQQSSTLAPEGYGVDVQPNSYLSTRDLTMAYLPGVDLSNSLSYYTKLINAELSQANLTAVDFRYSDLTGANLSQANLTSANLGNSDLTGANLS